MSAAENKKVMQDIFAGLAARRQCQCCRFFDLLSMTP